LPSTALNRLTYVTEFNPSRSIAASKAPKSLITAAMLLVIGFMAGKSWDSLYGRSTHCREEMCTWPSSCDDVRMVAYARARDMRVLLSPVTLPQSMHPTEDMQSVFSCCAAALTPVQPCQAHAAMGVPLLLSKLFDTICTHATLSTPTCSETNNNNNNLQCTEVCRMFTTLFWTWRQACRRGHKAKDATQALCSEAATEMSTAKQVDSD
jgi:hypothetical protein